MLNYICLLLLFMHELNVISFKIFKYFAVSFPTRANPIAKAQ